MKILAKNNGFAADFKLYLSSHELPTFCLDPSEKEELDLFIKFRPFSKYIQAPRSKKEIRPRDNELIQNEWKKQLGNDQLSFDDDKIFNAVWDQIKQTFSTTEDEEESDDCSSPKRFKKDENQVDENANFSSQMNFEENAQCINEYESIVRQAVYCERGKLLEKKIIKAVNKKLDMKFRQATKDSIDFGYFVLCGVPDGIDWEKKTIIEVKTKNFLFTDTQPVSDKEKLQCLCYMRLKNLPKCLLVESDQDGNQNIIELAWSHDEFTEKIYEKIKSMVIKYRNMGEDEFKNLLAKYNL